MVNRNAGRVDDEVTCLVCRLLAASGGLGVAVTSEPDEAEDVVRSLDGRPLVIAGGDGTLHDALNRLDRLGALGETDVGLVPLGTANTLARGIGLPLDMRRACETVVSGRPRSLDLLEGEGRVIANDVHTGIGVVAQGRVAAAKRLIGRFAYPVVNAATALTTDGWRIRVELDGVVLADDEPSLAVGVGNSPVIGNGTEVWPDARPDDGRLDVVVALAGRRASRLALGAAVARGSHVGSADVRAGTGSEVRITGGPGRHNADGELWHDVHDATYRVRPLAWRVLTAR